MSSNWVSAIVAIIVCLVGIGAHAVATAWWASKVTTTLNALGKSFEKFADNYSEKEKEYIRERYTRLEAKEDFAKRDDLIDKMWKKYDALRDEFAIVRNDISNHLKNGNHKGDETS